MSCVRDNHSKQADPPLQTGATLYITPFPEPFFGFSKGQFFRFDQAKTFEASECGILQLFGVELLT